MIQAPVFPSVLHEQIKNIVRDYFLNVPGIDTSLLINHHAMTTSESNLDFAVLVKPIVEPSKVIEIKKDWHNFSKTHTAFIEFRKLSSFANVHLNMIDGNFLPSIWDDEGGPDQFEIEIGNLIAYSAPIDKVGVFFQELQKRWLPYYNEKLRLKRLIMSKNACEYDLDHIPFYIKKGFYFQTFDRLYKAFQKFLQALFIANRTYPVAYNKWIKEQVEFRLNLPELYEELPGIISVSNIESTEIKEKAKILSRLLHDYCKE